VFPHSIVSTAMPAKKAAKPKTVSKEVKELKDQHVLEKSDTKRERKTPSRFSVAIPPHNTRELVIPKGRGTNIGSITAITEEIAKRKMDDPTLMTLHHLAFGMAAKRVHVKSNLRQFSGVKYDAKLDRAKLEQRIHARSHAVLRNVCTLLHLSSGGSTADLVGRIADFLERPTAPEKKTEAKKRTKAEPAAKKPAAKKPAAKKPAAKKPAAKKPAAKKPAAKKPAAKKAEPKKAEPKKAEPKKAEAKKPAEPKAKAEKKPAEPKAKAEKKPAATKPKAAGKPKATKAAAKK